MGGWLDGVEGGEVDKGGGGGAPHVLGNPADVERLAVSGSDGACKVGGERLAGRGDVQEGEPVEGGKWGKFLFESSFSSLIAGNIKL